MTDSRNTYWEQALNGSQLEAVCYCDSPLLVIAGAGSGKTRVLTYKIAYLLKEKDMSPRNILALTFTNKAAGEMNERIVAIAGAERAAGLWSGTFHSIFARILRIEAEAIGFTSNYTIYDTSDSRSLIKSIIKEMGLDDNVYKPAAVQYRISEAKNRLILPDRYVADRSIYNRDEQSGLKEVGKIYQRYFQRCKVAEAMDFDDLLLYTFLLFSQRKDILEKYQSRFRYILVDEYQDTNYAQHAIVSLLKDETGGLCVVGDDAQSIYSFRGANIDNILHFTQQYPDAKVVKLEQNYRSTQNIVSAANSLITHNRSQIPKNVFSKGDTGSRIRVISSYDDKGEATNVCGEVRRLMRQEHVPLGQIALLYRTNAQSRSFEDVFRDAKIPYRIYGGLSFYQRKEIKDVVAYLKLIVNPKDEEAFKRVVNYPSRGIGNTTVEKLQMAAREYGVSLWQVCTDPLGYGVKINRGTQAKIGMFCSMMLTFIEKQESMGAYELVWQLIKESGLRDELAHDDGPEGDSKRANVEELLSSIKEAETEMMEETGNAYLPIADYLSRISLLTDSDNAKDDEPHVALMTIHQAKGLEFDAVFITGLEDGLFPDQNAKLFPREMEEERRLMYVAITRARRFCFLTYAKSRFRYGTRNYSDPSPFLQEIDKQFLEADNEWRTSSASSLGYRKIPEQAPSFATTRRQATYSSSSPTSLNTGIHPRFVSVEKAEKAHRSANKKEIKEAYPVAEGNIIKHERFGIGKVKLVEGSGESMKATVEFIEAGSKTLLLKFARFEVLK